MILKQLDTSRACESFHVRVRSAVHFSGWDRPRLSINSVNYTGVDASCDSSTRIRGCLSDNRLLLVVDSLSILVESRSALKSANVTDILGE